MSVLNVLKSKGFQPVVTAIREKLPFLAEAILIELEADFAAHCNEYSVEEILSINRAIDECWVRIERLIDEQPTLKRMPNDGKHAVADGVMPEHNVLLMIYCSENYGGVAALGEDGKWYWAFDSKIFGECKYTVTHWRYL